MPQPAGATSPDVDDWRPSATTSALARRAAVLHGVRSFFAARGVLEVETPLLAASTTTEPAIESFEVPLGDGGRGWLQPSPEHAMKRLLAAGSGPIYQVTRSFRAAERGALHNPEFTILEWYRPGFDHHRLMDEVGELLEEILAVGAGRRVTYADAFADHADIDPFSCDDAALAAACGASGLADAALEGLGRDAMLDMLFTHRVQPALGDGLVFVIDYPASQAALARTRPGPPAVAERFEAFVDGLELGNGYHELTDAAEQASRFAADRDTRRARSARDVEPDRRLLAALAHGLPACAGVALGVDRLVMIAANASNLDQVIAFPFERA